jgi:malate dehydrogenase (oxaloacetate-decarboxylating)
MDYYSESLKLHERYKGKWEMNSKVPIETLEDLSLAYTPGVAQPCLEIEKDPDEVYKYTSKWNTVAIATDGSAALGLGNIGGMAAFPIMEGKAVLFKKFADIDAIPICLETQDTDEIVNVLRNIAPTFGGINLEDISAPRCFEIERKLQEQVDIPVFHDDQHGTAIVVSAGVINSSRYLGKAMSDMKIAMSGAGAAGTAIADMLMGFGVGDIVICDSKGIVSKDRTDLTGEKRRLAEVTNADGLSGSLADAMKGADVFVGVSQPGIVSQDMVRSMKKDPVIFAMSNPEPEILPDAAREAGAVIIGTGRSDFANQVNNLLAFPGVFRGALDSRAKRVTEEMKIAAAKAIADSVSDPDLSPGKIIPSIFDENVGPNVAGAVARAWEDQNI